MSIAGAQFYRLPLNQTTITLSRKSWIVPDHIDFGDQTLIPFRAGQTIDWTLTPATQA